MGKDLKGIELGTGFSQRKDGRYEARALINGNKIDIYDMNLKELKARFTVEKAKASKGIQSNPHVILLEWYEEWFLKFKSPYLKSDVSRRAYYRKCRNTYISILGEKRIEKIIQVNIQEATNELVDNGYSKRTIREGFGILRECLDMAIANRLIASNPCAGIKIADDDIKKERRVLTHKEQEIFLSEVKGTFYEEPYNILLLTGMRIGELGGLWWEDIDWRNKCIRINRSLQSAYYNGRKVLEITTPKTLNSYRTIPFFKETESILKSWRKKQDETKRSLGNRWRADPSLGDLVFTSSLGSPLTRYVLQEDLKRVEKNINLKEAYKAKRESREPVVMEHIHPHAFRHTFATRCFEKGLDPLFVQSIMGHANYSTTLSYTHLLETSIAKELEKVDGNFLD